MELLSDKLNILFSKWKILILEFIFDAFPLMLNSHRSLLIISRLGAFFVFNFRTDVTGLKVLHA